tara:strand:- start:447 stop:848 length:402 start_codon:yes stop_codon:yes gene_type:complete
MIFTYGSNYCSKCLSNIPNLKTNQNTPYNNNNISSKMLLSKRIRSNGKINSNSKSSVNINIYKILFRRNENEIKKILLLYGKRRIDYIVNNLTCSQNDKNITLNILEIYNNILESLEDFERQKIEQIGNNACH